MALEISRGTAQDIDALAPLWTAMVEHHRGLVGEQWPVRAADEAWALCRAHYQVWLADGTGILFVGRLGGADAISGYALCRLIPSGPTFGLGEVRGEVDSLVVAEDCRGTGAGSALLNACREELRRRGIRYWSVGVVEANRGAVALYERLGFAPWVRTMLAPTEDQA